MLKHFSLHSTTPTEIEIEKMQKTKKERMHVVGSESKFISFLFTEIKFLKLFANCPLAIINSTIFRKTNKSKKRKKFSKNTLFGGPWAKK